MTYIRQKKDTLKLYTKDNKLHFDSFVLDKDIFSNVFEKDIKRVYIYKKSERLARAVHLITPAFSNSPSLKDRLDIVAMELINASTLPPTQSKEKLMREILTLSSILSLARTGGTLSAMNIELIGNEAHLLLKEIGVYEEPRLFFEESPTLAVLSKEFSVEPRRKETGDKEQKKSIQKIEEKKENESKGQQGKSAEMSYSKKDRTQAILSILESKGISYIKDISTNIRNVSEKTIQRELQSLVEKGLIERFGERRWTQYKIK
jgi:predicted transcriptional regulator